MSRTSIDLTQFTILVLTRRVQCHALRNGTTATSHSGDSEGGALEIYVERRFGGPDRHADRVRKRDSPTTNSSNRSKKSSVVKAFAVTGRKEVGHEEFICDSLMVVGGADTLTQTDPSGQLAVGLSAMSQTSSTDLH